MYELEELEMSKDKKKDVFDELVNDPTFIKEADDAMKKVDKLPNLTKKYSHLTKPKNNTPKYIEELEDIFDKHFPDQLCTPENIVRRSELMFDLTKFVCGEIEKEFKKI